MNGVPKTIAVIDDDETTHYLVSVMLKTQLPELNVESFSSAIAFLERYVRGGYHADAMLLDINMPKMSGWELLDSPQMKDFTTPVHIFSSSEDARDLNRVGNYSFCKGYIVKPLTIEKVKKYISDISLSL